jgi:two-component system LytT family response regulator
VPDARTGAQRLRVVIADDEPLARDCMRLALREQRDVEILAECADGPQTIAAIREHAPDIVFLDVQMPAMDGFEVIASVGAEEFPAVVFVTAYDAHAIRAFEVHALDYVLKPFDDARILAALERARTRVNERRHGELGRRLAQLVRELPDEFTSAGTPAQATSESARAPLLRRFAIRDGDRVRFVAARDVEWIEADGNYVVLHANEQQHRVRGVLGRLVKQLDPRVFMRVHRSAIVNLEAIREVQPWFGGDYIAILRSGAKVRVSRMHAAQLLRPIG